jgi:hypothetical protein
LWRCYADRLVDGELLLTVEPRAQALPLHEGHHIVQQPVRFPRVEQRQEVRVLQVGRDLDLGQESLDTQDRAEFRIEHFQRDGAIVPDISGEVHRRHAPTTDLAIDRVSTLKGGAETGDHGTGEGKS